MKQLKYDTFTKQKKKSKVLITLIKRLLENKLLHTLVITSFGKEMFLHLSFLIYPTDIFVQVREG